MSLNSHSIYGESFGKCPEVWSMELVRFYCYVTVALNIQMGRTALHHAAEGGSKECLKVLVHEYRADPEEVDVVSR